MIYKKSVLQCCCFTFCKLRNNSKHLLRLHCEVHVNDSQCKYTYTFDKEIVLT